MTTVLIGYDVEACAIGEGLACVGAHQGHGMPEATDRTATRRGLEIIRRNHEEYGIPATLFVCGRTLVHNVEALEPFAQHPLFDLQQHTYSHVLLKNDSWQGANFEASPPEAVWQEVHQTSEAFSRLLGIHVRGLRTPHGYPLGLSDRPDMLQALHDCGIEFVSSWGRNEQGGNPTPLEVQPFWYSAQGFPDLLEIPFQGWLDGLWFEAHGLTQGSKYGQVLEETARRAYETGQVYGTCFHDWAQLRYDEMGTRWVRSLLEYCTRSQIPTSSYADFHQVAIAKRQEGTTPEPREEY